MIKIWDILSSICLKTIHAHSATVYTLVKIRDNEIISGSEDKSIKLWSIY